MRHAWLLLIPLALVGAPGARAAARALEAIPSPGALSFGSPPTQIQRVFGKPQKHEIVQGVGLDTYQLAGCQVVLGVYKGVLGGAIVTPKTPLSWPDAQAWARVFYATFDPARVRRSAPGEWFYAEEIRFHKLPFEVGFQFDLDVDRVTRIEGRLSVLE